MLDEVLLHRRFARADLGRNLPYRDILPPQFLDQPLRMLWQGWTGNPFTLGFGSCHTGFGPSANLGTFILGKARHHGKVELANVRGGIHILLI